MSDQITVTGLVATIPRHLVTGEGLPITSFRLASTQRRYDRSQQRWVDGETNWFTITSFRQIALNVNASVQKGQRVVVTGRLRVRDWESGENAVTSTSRPSAPMSARAGWSKSNRVSRKPTRTPAPVKPASMASSARTSASWSADAP